MLTLFHRIVLLRTVALACLLQLGLPAWPVEAGSDEPFGLSSTLMKEGAWWLIWHHMQTEMQAERPIVAQCQADSESCRLKAAEKFLALVKEGEGREGTARLGHVNRAVNLTIRFKENTPWTPPLVTLSTGIGDCKHYALMKYAALNTSGMPFEDLRLIVVKIRSLRAQHMVLAVRNDRHWLILDNRTLELVNSRDLADYEPLYAFDHRGTHQFPASSEPKIAQAMCTGAG